MSIDFQSWSARSVAAAHSGRSPLHTNPTHYMRFKFTRHHLILSGILLLVWRSIGFAAESPQSGTELTTIGAMHAVIGQGQSQARVSLGDLTRKPHFYGVGAAEGLAGEISFLDSKPTVTSVSADGSLRNALTEDAKATLLIGQSVTHWQSVQVEEDIPADDFDRHLRALAAQLGLPDTRAFMFLVEGEFQEVKLHVINGACPVHAKSRGIEIRKEHRPYEQSSKRMRGTLVGVHALNAAGRLTHPGTTTHRHLVFESAALNRPVTGHIEQAGVKKGARIKIAISGEH
ncbi:MAG: acetolactate decarboxylase [Verrucomicrobia bacterium]|nr:acetolactate decarboxylase [Verrucomicrobiota bacterium]